MRGSVRFENPEIRIKSGMIIWLTGCSSGLGRALVERFVEAGHTIAGCARRAEKITELREEFPGDHFFTVCDVSSDEDVREFCSEAFAKTRSPDFVINNAAIINSPAPLWEVSAEDVCGTANVIRHVVPMMSKAGKGIIVNLSSGWGRSTSPEVAPYCASKWAIEGLTRALAQELPEGLATVALNPGVIDTEMLRSAFGEGASAYGNATEWAKTAAPFILGLKASNNGEALTAP
jgi:NAD(P)-dependent dehydrogenase (short-subunit alcohol dehydrogenase family)